MNTVEPILKLSRPESFRFAVGFSRQPLPKGKRFASATNDDGSGITATDATIRQGCELAILRPETLAAPLAKMLPTANSFRHAVRVAALSHAAQAAVVRVGLMNNNNKTNGVKRKLPGPDHPGLSARRMTTPRGGRHAHVVLMAGA